MNVNNKTAPQKLRYAVSDDFEFEGYSSLNIACCIHESCVEFIKVYTYSFKKGARSFLVKNDRWKKN